MAISKTTRLMAVNTILSAAGEGPVASLTVNASEHSKIAEQILQECLNSVCGTGWYFNFRKNVTFAVNSGGEIVLPEEVIRIDFPGFGDMQNQYTIRNGKVYNKLTGSSSDFTKSLTCDIVTLMEWEDIPETFRNYIQKKAARLFVARHVSDPNLLRAVVSDEQEAMINAQRDDMATSNSRVFGPDMARIVDRGKPLDWVN